MTVIPFNRPSVLPAGYDYLRQAADNLHLSGDGPFTKRCHALLEAMTGANKALLTTSCTHALEMAALLLDIRPGDEVIVPTFTFVSTANAFVLRGATPVFVDSRPDTLNLDELQVAAKITPRTRAIVPVHYAGVGCDMTALGELAERHNLAIVEDAAHGLCGHYRGKPLGSFGRLAALSFHETKNFSCGEGGALLLNDPELCERAEIVREKGTNRGRFFRGQVDKYTWVDVGSSYLPSEVLAALLLSQLEAADNIQTRRLAVWNRYAAELSGWAADHAVRLPTVPADCRHPAHLFYLVMPSASARTAMLAHLKADGVNAVFHYLPLHLSEYARRYGGNPGDCPVAESASDRLVRLPLFFGLTDAEQARVIAAVQEFRPTA